MITAFKGYLQAVGYAPGSITNLCAQAASFIQYAALSGPGEATPCQIQDFYGWLHERANERRGGGISDSHIHHHMYALRVFFGWLEHSGQLRENPISALVFKRPQRQSREPLSREQVRALFEAAGSERETAALHLLYSCGLRRMEAVMLDTADVHYRSRLLYVRRGKGRKRRAVPLPEKVAGSLEAYATGERVQGCLRPGNGSLGYRHPTAFLLNKVGGRISGGSLNLLLQALKKRAGIETEVTPHYLRHSIATHLLASGVSLMQVRVFLGHSHLESTQLYVKVSTAQIRSL